MTLVRGTVFPVAAAVALSCVTLCAAPASAVSICEQYGTTAAGNYVIMNNRWGAATEQCIETTANGFRISQANHSMATDGAPASYPAIYYGCHYGNCSSGTILPLPVSDARVQDMTSSVSMNYPATGEWDAAYDIWYDPTSRRTGQNTGMEVMIWMSHLGRPQPIGSKVGTATIAGVTWDVWYGRPGWNVVSFVAQSPRTSLDFRPHDFFRDAVDRGYAQNSWYLTSLQAGFEPWIGGSGLSVDSFSVTPGGGAKGASVDASSEGNQPPSTTSGLNTSGLNTSGLNTGGLNTGGLNGSFGFGFDAQGSSVTSGSWSPGSSSWSPVTAVPGDVASGNTGGTGDAVTVLEGRPFMVFPGEWY